MTRKSSNFLSLFSYIRMVRKTRSRKMRSRHTFIENINLTEKRVNSQRKNVSGPPQQTRKHKKN